MLLEKKNNNNMRLLKLFKDPRHNNIIINRSGTKNIKMMKRFLIQFPKNIKISSNIKINKIIYTLVKSRQQLQATIAKIISVQSSKLLLPLLNIKNIKSI